MNCVISVYLAYGMAVYCLADYAIFAKTLLSELNASTRYLCCTARAVASRSQQPAFRQTLEMRCLPLSQGSRVFDKASKIA